MAARLVPTVLLAAACAAVLMACTSSGDGGAGDTDDFLNRGAVVVPDDRTATEWVEIQETSGDRTTTCVSVGARNATNVFAAAFTVSYDPTLLAFTGWSDAGTCLGPAGERLSTLVDATTTPGDVVVGLSRNGAVTSAGQPCGHFVELCFDVIGDGTSRLAFTGNRELLDPLGAPVVVEWLSSDVETRL